MQAGIEVSTSAAIVLAISAKQRKRAVIIPPASHFISWRRITIAIAIFPTSRMSTIFMGKPNQMARAPRAC